MRYLISIFLVAFCLFQFSLAITYVNVTCWDACQMRCRARYGWLENSCMQGCACPCDKTCEGMCNDFNLGDLCRFKCGCFQDHVFVKPTDDDVYDDLIPKPIQFKQEKAEEKPAEKPIEKPAEKIPEVPKNPTPVPVPEAPKAEPIVVNKTIPEPTPAELCTKTCSENCLKTESITIAGMIKCLKHCKCDKQKSEQLMKEVKLGNERSFGKMEWGTFFVTFFILSSLASGAFNIHKKYNYVKEYHRFYKIGGISSGLYQRLV